MRISLSTLPAGKPERRRALAVVLVSLAIFAVIAPFAKVKLAPGMAFVPSYQSALAINDLITAILLFGKLSVLKRRARASRSRAPLASLPSLSAVLHRSA